MRRTRGEVMLLTVLVISGMLLGATAVAGLLMTYALRTATNSSDSMRAIFAADTGVEWELYKKFRNCGDTCPAKPVMRNGAEFETRLSADGESVKSTGYADSRRKVARAFELIFAAFE